MFGVCAFGVLELSLRICGFGRDLRLIVPQASNSNPQLFQFNPWVDQAYYGRVDLSGPEPRPFAVPKPAGTFRIVVIGGSTVIGFPYAPELSFPRHLEIMLQAQWPEQRVEVLNAGVTAVNSFAEADLLEQALACQPDLVIVYTGHNEFYGPGGAGSTIGAASPMLYTQSIRLNRLRLGQAARRLLQGRQRPPDQLLEALPGDLRIPLDGATFHRAAAALRSNLESMVRDARHAGVPVLLASPVCNLRDQSPLQALSRPGLTAEDQRAFQTFLEAGEALLAKGECAAALDSFNRAGAIDSGHALLTFRRAQCLEELGRFPEAAAAYALARDQDGCRFRAPSLFTKIMAEVAASNLAGEVCFVDLSEKLAAAGKHGTPGQELFLEHVHFNQSGNAQVARSLAESILTRILKRNWAPQRALSSADCETRLGIVPQDELAARSLALLALARLPLSLAADRDRQLDFLRRDLGNRLQQLTPFEQAVFADMGLDLMESDLIGELASRYGQAHELALQADVLQKGRLRRPWRASLSLQLAQCLARQEKWDEARRSVRQALELEPRSIPAQRLNDLIERELASEKAGGSAHAP
jgi:tetratricopeptide (TPR) repeat protein